MPELMLHLTGRRASPAESQPHHPAAKHARGLGRARMVGRSVRPRNSSSGAVRCAERDSGSSTAQICHSSHPQPQKNM